MAGLLNSPQAMQPSQSTMPTAPQSGQSSIADPTLQKIVSGIEAKLSPGIRQNYLSCVNAGMAAMFGAQSGNRVINKLKSSQNVQSDIASGIANVFATIYNEIAGKMAPAQRQKFMGTFLPALLAASSILTCHALDVAEKLGRIKVTPDLAAQTIHDSAMACLQKVGIGPQQIQQVTSRAQQSQGAQPQVAPQPAQPMMAGGQ